MSVGPDGVEIRTKTQFLPDPTIQNIQNAIAPFLDVMKKSHLEYIAQKNSPSRHYENCLRMITRKKPRLRFKNVWSYFVEREELRRLLEFSTATLKSYTKSSGAVCYVANLDKGLIYHCPHKIDNKRHLVTFKIETGKTLATYVASTKEYVVVNDVLQDERFPSGLAWKDSIRKRAMCIPVVTPSNVVIAVIELTKDKGEDCYTIIQLEAAITLASWIGATIQNSHEAHLYNQETQMNKYCIELINFYHVDNVPIEIILSEILMFTKGALRADKCFFYIFYRTHSHDFRVKIFEDASREHVCKSYFMLSKSRTAAAHVSKTKKLLNTTSCHEYDTTIYKGIACNAMLVIPIMRKNEVIGVVELINKKEANFFSEQDERIFSIVASYCQLPLASFSSRMGLNILRSKMGINDDMLAIHMQPCEHDLKCFNSSSFIPPEKLFTSGYYPEVSNENLICHLTKSILLYTLGKRYEEGRDLDKFILLIAKFHSKHEYINLQHTFNTFHAVANIIRKNPFDFTHDEKEEMLVAALCHSVDEKGILFVDEPDNYPDPLICHYPKPLYLRLYFIVRLCKNCNIFSNVFFSKGFEEKLSSLFHLIRSCSILHTLQEKKDLVSVLKKEEFDSNNLHHRFLLKTAVMAVSEFSCYYKYPITAIKIFAKKFLCMKEENELLGKKTVYSLNKENKTYLAEQQVEFIRYVMLPWLYLVNSVLPNTEELYFMCEDVMYEWLTISSRFIDPIWQTDLSFGKMKSNFTIDVEKLQ